MKGDRLPTQDLVEAYDRTPRNLLCVDEVALSEVSKYGIVVPGKQDLGSLISVAGLIEKPAADKAPSQLASFGRYVFEPEIFGILRTLKPGTGGEIQLADAIDQLAHAGKVAALKCSAARYDCGAKFGYLSAIVDHAVDHPEYRDEFFALIRDRLATHEAQQALQKATS